MGYTLLLILPFYPLTLRHGEIRWSCLKSHMLQPPELTCIITSCVLCMLSRFSPVRLFAMPWTVACQAPQSIVFSRQEYRSVLPFPPLGGLPNPGIKFTSLTFLALANGFFPTSATSGASLHIYLQIRWYDTKEFKTAVVSPLPPF